MDTKLRELTYRLVDMAPQAPPYPGSEVVQLQPTSEATAPARRSNPLVWAAAAAAVALAVVGVPLVVFGPGGGTDPTTIPPAVATTAPEQAPTTDVPVTAVPSTVSYDYAVYLLSEEITTPAGDPALVAVSRTESVETELLADELAGLALDGLRDSDLPDGFSTAVPGDALWTNIRLDDGVAMVDFPAEFEAGGGTALMRARLAQVVFTATQFPEVDAVLFMIEGEPVEVFSAEGIVLDGPQTRADWYDEAQAVYVDVPLIGSVVGSPISLSGVANVFEGNLEFEVSTAGGSVVTGGSTTASCGSGCWGDFSAEIPYVLEARSDGFVTVYVRSAEDGSRQDLISLPITFEAAEWSGPPQESAVAATEQEAAVMAALETFAKDPAANFAAVALADEVSLGLGPDLIRTMDAADLADPAAWVMDIDLFRARAGTASALDLLAEERPRRVVTGDHLHCASPPVAAPSGLEGFTRISTQPTDATSCLEWFSVDVFVDGDGDIVAVTIDLYEP
jgi:spore germination protein GerM